MSALRRVSTALAMTGGLLVLWGAAPGAAASTHWQLLAEVGDGGISPAPLLAQASAPPATSATTPEIDLTALRYFAQQGDTRRLEAEIARLRALYPDWQPPENPLEIPAPGDPELDRVWQLYSEGRYAEVREALAARARSEPGWQAPADLLERLGVAEARVQLVNASNLEQHETVIRLASENPSLLTCSEVDVLWRVARAFVGTGRPDRGRDAYAYVLNECDNTGERLATIQMAGQFLPRADLDPLLAAERTGPDGVGEFAAVRADLARASLAAAANDASVSVPDADLQTLRRLVKGNGSASDLELLGWYSLRREDYAPALDYFGRAKAAGDTSSISQGYALSLIPFGRFAQAEEAMAPWRDASEGARAVYLAAAANLLATRGGQPLDQPVILRVVGEVAQAQDAATAQQLGWYSYGLNQFEAAAQWFSAALGWRGDDEQSAYGLALVRQRVGDAAGLAALQRDWAPRSPRIAAIGRPDLAAVAAAQATREANGGPPPTLAATPAPAPAAQPATAVAATAMFAQPAPVQAAVAPAAPAPVQSAPPARRAAARTGAAPMASAARRPGRCAATGLDPSTLSPDAAMAQGWCLLDLDRSLEATSYFESAARRGGGRTRQDAAYGESLAYLRLGVSDRAAVAASRSPQPAGRRVELDVAILSARATGAFERRRPVEALQALDERARLAPERLDLMVLRGFAYLELSRYADAERVFSAVARTGSLEGARGLEAVRQALNRSPTGG